MNGKITIVFEENPDGWITAHIPEIPGAISQGKTRDEAREMVLDALNELMISRREDVPHSARAEEETHSFEILIEKSA